MKKVLLLITIFILLAGCKTTDKKVDKTNGSSSTKKSSSSFSSRSSSSQVAILVDKRTVFTIDEKKLATEELKGYIKDLFAAIEEKIAQGDFEGWFVSITKNYRDYISNKDNLKKMSAESSALANSGIMLQDPKDYFLDVVIKARSGKVLKFNDFKYLDKLHLKVICSDDKTKFEYSFIYEDNAWKLDR
jgi:hypothetical protein